MRVGEINLKEIRKCVNKKIKNSSLFRHFIKKELKMEQNTVGRRRLLVVVNFFDLINIILTFKINFQLKKSLLNLIWSKFDLSTNCDEFEIQIKNLHCKMYYRDIIIYQST